MLPFFYHKELAPGNQLFTLSESSSRHCIQVLRMQEGEQLQLTNGEGLTAVVAIVAAHKKNCQVKIISADQAPEPAQKNVIAISLLKNNTRFEWFLEKATELGISEIVPLLCKRTERQSFKEDRLQTILISAMLQSQQHFLPKMGQPQKFSAFLANMTYDQKLIAHCGDGGKNKLTHSLQANGSQLILIGPEGDFDEQEIAQAIQQGFVPVSLGDTRLRTETAGVVAATLMQLGK